MSTGLEFRVYRVNEDAKQGEPNDALFAYWHVPPMGGCLRPLRELSDQGRARQLWAKRTTAHQSYAIRADDVVSWLWPDGPHPVNPATGKDREPLLGPSYHGYIYRKREQFEALGNELLLIEITDDDMGWFAEKLATEPWPYCDADE